MRRQPCYDNSDEDFEMRLSFSTKRRPRLTTRVAGPVYVTIGPRQKPRVQGLFSGKGWLVGRTLFKSW